MSSRGAPTSPWLILLYIVGLTQACLLLSYLAVPPGLDPGSPTSNPTGSSNAGMRMRRQHVLLAMEDDATRRLYSTEDAHYQEVPYVLKAQGEEEDEDFSANAVGLSKAAQLAVSRPARLSETCYREEQMLETWCANDAPNLDALSCEVHISNTTIDVYREPLVPGEAPFASCRTLWFGGFHMGDPSRCQGDGGGYRAEYAAALGSWLMYAQDTLQPVLVMTWQDIQNATDDKEFMTSWAEERGVIVIHVESFSFQEHLNAAGKTGGITGAFMRLDIPRLVEEHKLFDLPGVCGPEVLYTDSDVVFVNPITREDMDVVKRGVRRDSTTAVAYGPEFKMNAAATENTGVMIMHVDRFRNEWPMMLQFALEQEQFPEHDQALMNEYFMRPDFMHLSVGLPVYWNWKTYWPVGPGMWPEIKVLHTHGPKSERGLWRMANCDTDLEKEPKVAESFQGLIAQGICCNRGMVANRIRDIYHAVLPELNVCQD